MERRVSLPEAVVLLLLALSFLAAVPAGSAASPNAQPVSLSPPQPVWATLNALGYGNYPGGNEEFTVFVVNTDAPPLGNVSLFNETLTAPALPPAYDTGYGIGLPVQLASGQGILTTIHLEIPSSFTLSNFTATVVIDTQIANGTGFIPMRLTESTTVVMLNLPGTPVTSTTSTVSTTQETTQSTGVSSGLFYAGVGVPSVVAVILLALLVRARGRP